MSTHALIAIKENENVYKGIYCHFDGYIRKGVGEILENNYKSKEKMQNLIDLGALSFLRESIECPEGHSFDNPVEGYSVFYRRDRGETDNVDSKTFTYDSLIKNLKFNDYEYLYIYNLEENRFLVYYIRNDVVKLYYLDELLENL